jgi:hypothetical protein
MNEKEFNKIRNKRFLEEKAFNILGNEIKNILSNLNELPPAFEVITSIQNINGKIHIEVKVNDDEDNLTFKKINLSDARDSSFILALNKNLKDLGEALLEFTRELHKSGILVKSQISKRYTNYNIEGDKVYFKKSMNFVSFIPQKESIKVFVYKGDYLNFSTIKLIKSPRYYSFHVQDGFQLDEAKKAIEISLFHYRTNPIDLNEDIN